MKTNKIIKLSALCAGVFALCSCEINKTGGYAYMTKVTGNHYGEVLYDGFSKVLSANKIKHFDKSPAEASVGDQIQMIETLTLQKVSAITVSAAGTTGYDNVLKQATDRGIKVLSVDSPISPKYRITHIDHCDPKEVGKWLADAAILISLKEEYPIKYIKEGGSLAEYTASKCAEYTGTKKMKFGFLTSTIDSPSQNDWIDAAVEELKNSNYSKVVDNSVDYKALTKYGNDDPIESKKQANAFITEGSVDVIIAPTTVAVAAAGQALLQAGDRAKNIKLTGLGMPSEMYGYMPDVNSSDEDIKKKSLDSAFNFVCPYIMLWRVDLFGEIAATATMRAVNGLYDGKVGSKFDYFDEEGNPKTFETVWFDESNHDKGTKVVSLKPYAFHKENISEWKSKL